MKEKFPFEIYEDNFLSNFGIEKQITLNFTFPSQNDFHCKNWETYQNQHKKKWKKRLKSIKEGYHNFLPRVIKFISLKKKTSDLNNLQGSKVFPDILQDYEWIFNDSVYWFHGIYRQEYSKEDKTRIIIYSQENELLTYYFGEKYLDRCIKTKERKEKLSNIKYNCPECFSDNLKIDKYTMFCNICTYEAIKDNFVKNKKNHLI